MRSILFALLLVSAVACKKESGNSSSATTETKPADPKVAEGSAAAPKPADMTAQGSGSAGAAAMPMNGEPVDVCAILTKDQVEKATGAKVVGEPTKDAPQGSLLGGCMWTTDKGAVSVSARPASEYDATAASGTDVPGVGAGAKMTKSGLLMKLEGKPYFLHVMTMNGTKIDPEKTKEVAMMCGGPPMNPTEPNPPTKN